LLGGNTLSPCMPLFSRRPHRAQSLLEFGLILPILLVILLGMVDFGRAYVFGVAVQQGARESARAGVTAFILGNPSTTNQQMFQRIIDASRPVMIGCTAPVSGGTMTCTDGHGITWTVTISPSGTKSGGQQLNVRASGQMPLFVGFLTGLAGINAINIQGDASMVVL
jgi:Flp pilus assembly protein TadG